MGLAQHQLAKSEQSIRLPCSEINARSARGRTFRRHRWAWLLRKHTRPTTVPHTRRENVRCKLLQI
jgi:hypothetical protein